MATLTEFEKWFAPYSYKAIIKENNMSDFKDLEVEGTVKSIKDYDNRRVISIGQYYGKTAIAAWFNKFEGEGEKDALMELKPNDFVKINGYQTKDGWNNATGFEVSIDVNADIKEPTNGKPSPTPSTNGLDGMTKCNVTNNGTLIYCELIKTGTLPDREVLIQLFDEIAGWHRKNGG